MPPEPPPAVNPLGHPHAAHMRFAGAPAHAITALPRAIAAPARAIAALALAIAALAHPAAAAAGEPPRHVADTLAERVLACTGCHGAQGRAATEGFVPRIAGKPAGYLQRQLINFRAGLRRHEGMSRLLEGLPDAYLAEIAGHFAALNLPPEAPPRSAAALPAAAAARAQQLAQAGDPARGLPACATCHGAQLGGLAPDVPGLAGLPRDYLAAQLGAWRLGTRRAAAPDCMARIARDLPEADLPALVDWLARQPHARPVAGATPAMAAALASCGPGGAQRAPAEPGPSMPAGPTVGASPAATALGATPSAGDVERGAYLAKLGHCAGCHTARGGVPFAGGRGIATPFGTVYAGNLTPDATTGLGRWSAEDFWQALHQGRAPDGRALLPAFPYTEFTQLTRSDSDALWAYLRTLPAVVQARPAHELRFPYSTRWAIEAWRALYFRPGSYVPDATRSAQWNRGAYLVRGLGHCAACHAPRGRLGGPGRTMNGGWMPGGTWWAPPLQGGTPADAYSAEQMVALLQSGQSARGTALGPMADVVVRSTQHATLADLQAMATYLASLAGPAQKPPRPLAAGAADSAPTPAPAAPAATSAATSAALSAAASAATATAAAPSAPPDTSARLERGARLYATACADCHGERGQGVPGIYPALAGNATVQQPHAVNLVQVLRFGGFAPATAAHPRPFGMPPVDLNDAAMADLLTFIRRSWGHDAPAVSELEVLRAKR